MMNDQFPLGRRELLRVGALSVLAAPAAASRAVAGGPPRVRRRSCIFIMLQGGPSHHDLWDPKPNASVDIRGTFQTIGTAISGVRFGELLPGSAKVANHLAIVRSMSHKFNNHIAGTYVTVNGSDNQPNIDREAHSDDFPGPGAVLNWLENKTPQVPRSVSLPNWLSIPGPSKRMPGQYGGFLGSIHDPFLIAGDPNKADFRPLSLVMPKGVDAGRLQRRMSLTRQLDRAAWQLERNLARRYDQLMTVRINLSPTGACARRWT